MFEFGKPIFRVKIGIASAEIFQITKDNKKCLEYLNQKV